MELNNDFSVPVPIDRAWEVLNDVELIAPCLPGAELQEIEGDEYRGIVKVKVGPITAQYKGAAIFTERDRENGRLVIDASGRDTRGQGSASAVITVTMSESGGTTSVNVNSDVTIKGKVAQFGRGMIADVSGKLLTQFVECLETKLEAPADQDAAAPAVAATAPAVASSSTEATSTAAPTAPAADAPAAATGGATADPAPVASEEPKVRKVNMAASEPVDLLDTAGAPIAKRLGPVLAVLAVLLLLGRRRRRRRSA